MSITPISPKDFKDNLSDSILFQERALENAKHAINEALITKARNATMRSVDGTVSVWIFEDTYNVLTEEVRGMLKNSFLSRGWKYFDFNTRSHNEVEILLSY